MKYKHIFKKTFNNTPVNYNIIPLSQDESMSNRIQSKNGSICKYAVEFSDGNKSFFIGKHKSSAIIVNGAKMLAKNDIFLMLGIVRHNKVFGYEKSWKREAILYSKLPADLKRHLPVLLGFCISPLFKKSFLAMEEFKSGTIVLKKDIYRILDAICSIHNRYYNKTDIIKEFCLNHYSPSDYKKIKGIIKTLFNQLHTENVQFFSEDKLKIINNFIEHIESEYEKVSFHQTLTHNDFSDRNISVSDKQLIIYDWELACFQNPEHDVIEIVLSIMDSLSVDEIANIFDYHKKSMVVSLPDETYRMLLRFNLLEYCVNKLSLLRYAEGHLNINYTPKILKNISTLMDILNIKE